MNQNIITDTVTADVLVIGSGIAGIFAAIKAKEQGLNVLLLTKGLFGKDGAATWMAGQGFQVALYPPDSPEVHAKDIIKAGRFLVDQQLVYECTKIIPEIFHQLCRWGVEYQNRDGKFYLKRLSSESFPRNPILARPIRFGGRQFRSALTKKVRQLGIRTIDDVFTVDLISNQGCIGGAVLLDIKECKITLLRTKATVLATGGYMGCYPKTLTPTETGDGCAMAYRAGAEITDMEFASFFPYVAVWPPAFRGDDWPGELAWNLGAVMYNRAGDEFKKKYKGQLRSSPLAIASELRAGRGSPHGGIYLSLRHLPANLVSDYLDSLGHEKWRDKVKRVGFDLFNDAVEIAPAGITSYGGCKVNKMCETNLDNLYAAGELVASREGACSMPGNDLPLSAATGFIAGEYAAQRAQHNSLPEVNRDQVNSIIECIKALLGTKIGLHPFEVKNKAQSILNNHAGLLGRTDNGLSKGLAEIEELKTELQTGLRLTSTSRRFNLELVQALETRNIVETAALILRAALERKESRGFHFREDYPQEDPNWLKHIVFKKVGGEPTVIMEAEKFVIMEPPSEGNI